PPSLPDSARMNLNTPLALARDSASSTLALSAPPTPPPNPSTEYAWWSVQAGIESGNPIPLRDFSNRDSKAKMASCVAAARRSDSSCGEDEEDDDEEEELTAVR